MFWFLQSLLQKIKSGMGIPDWDVAVATSTFENSCGYRYAGNDRADRLVGNATITNGLLLGKSEMLRSLRHYLRAQSQGHHTVDRLKERDVERGSARRSSLKGQEKAIVN